MIMTVFGPFLFFVLLNSMTVRVSGQNFGKCMPLTMMTATFIMYFSQMIFKTFRPGEGLLAVAAAAALILLIKSWRDGEEAWKERCWSRGFWAFAAIYLIYLTVDFGRNFNGDELSHWGVMVKEMLRTGRFYSEPVSHLLVHKDYPPFISVFEMLWCRICGGYSETAVSMALHVLSLSLLVPWLTEGKEREKRGREFGTGFFLTLIFILVISAFDVYGIFHTIYTDMIMPILYVYCISLILSGEALNSCFGGICLVVGASALMLTKQMSVAFVLLIWFYYGITLYLDRKKGKKPGRMLWLAPAVTMIPLANYMIWDMYIDSLGLSGQFEVGMISPAGILSILTGGGSRAQNDTFKMFFDALFHRHIFSGIVSMTYASAFLAALLFLYLLMGRKGTGQEKEEAFKLGAVFVCGTLV